MKKNLILYISFALLIFTGCKEDYGDIVIPTKPADEQQSGFGYIGGFESEGAKAAFYIEAPGAGNYKLDLRGTNTSPKEGTGSLYINGNKKSQIKFKEEKKWNIETIEVTLLAGENIISIQRDAGDTGLFYLDYIELQ